MLAQLIEVVSVQAAGKQLRDSRKVPRPPRIERKEPRGQYVPTGDAGDVVLRPQTDGQRAAWSESAHGAIKAMSFTGMRVRGSG